MQSKFIYTFLLIALLSNKTFAQESKKGLWDLNQCLSYALENNIQVKQQQLEVLSSEINLVKSKAERLPSLNASISENISNSKDITNGTNWSSSNSASFSINSNMSIYQGGATANSIKKSKLAVEQANVNVEVTQKNITLSIVQSYLNILYSKESLDYFNEVVSTSQKQVDRTSELYKAGSVVRKDLAQMEAQLSSDKYSLTVAKNNLISNTTTLKQLLEIPVTDTFNVSFPELEFIDSLIVLPKKLDAINSALSIMPEVRSSKINSSIAETNLKIAQSGYYPSLSLSAAYSTDYSSNLSNSFAPQLSDNQIQRVGLTLNIPIFNRYSTKTSVQQSRIGIEQAKLSSFETEKNLMQQVESVYQDAAAGISRYQSAKGQMESATESYKLSEQQFNLGMINIVELLKVKSTLLNAQMELIQAKYSAILNFKILDFYMGKTITL